ncbi:MAG: ACT domain-containing protein [Clostridiales Family XIII bacterium]|jgi:hypothetical protein|nr:ACT domain-containing protein [Clostridiales Family XIII bacterium]
MSINQISVFVENKPGKLADITEILAKAEVDLRAMSIADTQDFGILRLIVDNPHAALTALRDNGCTVNVTSVLAVEMPDKPGGLAGVLRVLADKNVNVEYLYAFISRSKGNAYVILRVEDNEEAMAVLKEAGIGIVTAEQIYS